MDVSAAGMYLSVAVSIVTLAAVVFQAGRITARIDALHADVTRSNLEFGKMEADLHGHMREEERMLAAAGERLSALEEHNRVLGRAT